MKKVNSSFVVSLIFSLIGLGCSYLFMVVFVLVGAFTNGVIKTIITIIPYINMAMYIISLIGSCICLSKRKLGGNILILASTISLICLITLCISIKAINLLLIMFWLPAIINLFTGIKALKSQI